jgi:hypothetical protein
VPVEVWDTWQYAARDGTIAGFLGAAVMILWNTGELLRYAGAGVLFATLWNRPFSAPKKFLAILIFVVISLVAMFSNYPPFSGH